MLSNCGAEEDLYESLGQQEDQLILNQSWIFTGRTDGEAEAPIPWLPEMKSLLFGKDLYAGKVWRQKKEAAEDEMVSIMDLMDMNLSRLQKIVEKRGAAVCGVTELEMT